MDPQEKRKALRLLTYGLYVATSRDDHGSAGGTINWLSQSSFTPPLIMAGIQHDSTLHQAIAQSRVFAVHILGQSQREMAMRFFKGAEENGNTLNGYRFEGGVTGAPVLVDPPAWLECRVVQELAGGDHTIFVGEVVAAGVRREEVPLTLRETGLAYGG